jgi:hypothetical protein
MALRNKETPHLPFGNNLPTTFGFMLSSKMHGEQIDTQAATQQSTHTFALTSYIYINFKFYAHTSSI